jgi:hypothetical protein
VSLDGLLAEHQLLSDGRIGLSLGNQAQHVQLSLRQVRKGRRDSSGRLANLLDYPCRYSWMQDRFSLRRFPDDLSELSRADRFQRIGKRPCP